MFRTMSGITQRGITKMTIDGSGVRLPKHFDGKIQLQGQEQPVHVVYDTFMRDEVITVGSDHYALQSKGGGEFDGLLKYADQNKNVMVKMDPKVVDMIKADPAAVA